MIRELQGFSVEQITEDLDHASIDTTDGHYLANEGSNAEKDKKIAALQDKYVSGLKSYGCKLECSSNWSELRDAINAGRSAATRQRRIAKTAEALHTTERAVVHLMSPGGQTYIGACENALAPTWPEHQRYLKPGHPCRLFNKCVFCKQARIFPEALPYVACRVVDLEKLRSKMNAFEWESVYGAECEAWREVLEDWTDRKQVAKAFAMAKRGEVVLPIRMRGV